jgi:hypothetical protein
MGAIGMTSVRLSASKVGLLVGPYADPMLETKAVYICRFFRRMPMGRPALVISIAARVPTRVLI